MGLRTHYMACIGGAFLLCLLGLPRPVLDARSKSRKQKERIRHRKPLTQVNRCANTRRINMTVANACLKLTSPNMGELVYPDDAEEHFEQIHIALAHYTQDKNHRMHSAANFRGPWIENIWISHFEALYDDDTCLSEIFGPFIPIFIPWVDHWVNNGHHYPDELPKLVRSLLRPNVPYITVSQNDEGLPARSDLLAMDLLPNLLVLSAGGYGHVPIPLFKQNETRRNDQIPVPDRSVLVSYVGSLVHAPGNFRQKLHNQLETWSNHPSPPLTGDFSYRYYKGDDWRETMADSRFSLSPRGFGRTAYHVVETWQMGLIPVQVYSDVAWMPYQHLLGNIAFATDLEHLQETMVHLQSLSVEEIREMEERIVSMRDSHFSMTGVMPQIHQFMMNQHSDLVCQELPRTSRGEKR